MPDAGQSQSESFLIATARARSFILDVLVKNGLILPVLVSPVRFFERIAILSRIE
jgi:hypothetical protein